MANIDLVLYIVAVILFGLAGFNVPAAVLTITLAV
jgi:hypothetical protein